MSLKHYLRGEEGILYEDLYHLVKYLPAYSLPTAIAPQHPRQSVESPTLSIPPTSPGKASGGSQLQMGHSEPIHLLPAHSPPKWTVFDVFPFSLLVKSLTKRGKDVGGRKAARLRARMGRGTGGRVVSQNVPLEITLYLVCPFRLAFPF